MVKGTIEATHLGSRTECGRGGEWVKVVLFCWALMRCDGLGVGQNSLVIMSSRNNVRCPSLSDFEQLNNT
jgi:hypothetical protein